jgi:hypothetical protein
MKQLRLFNRKGDHLFKQNLNNSSESWIRILSSTETHVQYSTSFDNFRFVRKAKIRKQDDIVYFICLYGGKRPDIKQKLVYITGGKHDKTRNY